MTMNHKLRIELRAEYADCSQARLLSPDVETKNEQEKANRLCCMYCMGFLRAT